MSLISFGSDNHAGVHPQIFAEMLKANEGFAASYEQDLWSQKLKKTLLQLFDAQDSAMVFNGTAANVICLQLALKSYQSVICADQSHLNIDECGAPEKIAGVKLITIPSRHGKIIIEEVEKALIRKGDQHHSQVKLLSITQPTEYGTLYSLEEMRQISEICKKHQLYLHMDGARLANACVETKQSLQEITQYADLISFGGAKNGLMLGEFVIVRHPALKEGLKFIRKQSLQLPSKTRFLAAAFLKYLDNNLWQEIADHENSMADLLFQELSKIQSITITQPRQANAVFCILPQEVIKTLRKQFFFYIWNEKTFEVRLMTSFATKPEHIHSFITLLKSTLNKETR